MKECTTHHYACDCREREFAKILEQRDELLRLCEKAVNEFHHWQIYGHCREELKAAIKKARGQAMLTLLLACAIGDRSLTVNTIELNHVYDRRCELTYTQVILWDIDASDGRLHNVGWRFVKRCQDMPVRCGKRWMLHADGKTIYAVHFRETWTHFDRERQDSQEFWGNEAPNLFEVK